MSLKPSQTLNATSGLGGLSVAYYFLPEGLRAHRHDLLKTILHPTGQLAVKDETFLMDVSNIRMRKLPLS